MRPTDYLQTLNEDDWHSATTHAFCKELADGTLPIEKMKAYLLQDYLFVDGFVRLLASAIAHAPTLDNSIPAAQFLAVITSSENTYFLRALDAFGVTEQERNVAPAPVTSAFIDLMARAVKSGRYEQMLAVLNVAEWSYLTWAQPFHPPSPDLPFWYAEWITLHSGEGFEAVVDYLRGQLDDQWAVLDGPGRAAVKALFKEAVLLERQFFDSAYQGFGAV